MFGAAQQVANDTGLGSVAMDQAMGMVGGPMGNEDQLTKFYHLLATHPNEVSLFFLHHVNEKGQPVFIAKLLEAIELLIKKNLYEWFNSGAFKGDYIDVEKAVENGYTSITQENIDMVIAHMVPLQQIAQEVQQCDAAAMQIVQQAKFQALSVEQQSQHHQQQQVQQQQIWSQQQQHQQMMPPQRPSLFSSLAKIAGVTAAGAVGGAGAQNVATQLLVEQPNQGYAGQPAYGQQPQTYQMPAPQTFVPGQQMPLQQTYQQPYNGVTGQPV
jgi:hypothetical protein